MAKKSRKDEPSSDESVSDGVPAVVKPPPALRPELLEELLAAAGGPGGLTGKDGLLKQLTAALVNRALDAEMSEHLGYESKESPPEQQTNRRNGHRTKTVRSEHGELDVHVPRDREGSFEPKLVGKHERHFDGFDDKILSMYARGMSTRDIGAHLNELYGVDVSPDLISRVTDAVVDELNEWQSRALESVYPVIYIDALVVKVRDQGKVENKAVHIVVGVDLDGERDVLGWAAVSPSERDRILILGVRRPGARLRDDVLLPQVWEREMDRIPHGRITVRKLR